MKTRTSRSALQGLVGPNGQNIALAQHLVEMMELKQEVGNVSTLIQYRF